MSNSQQLLNSVTNEGMTFLSSDVAETVKNVGVVVNAQTDPSSTNIIVIPPTDRELSSTSGNPVEYHAVKKEYDKKVKNITTPGTGFFVKSSGGTVFQDPIAGGMSSRYETSNAEPITNAGILNSKFAEYLDFPTDTASYDRYYSASGYVGPAPRKQTINSNAATSNNEPFSNNAFNTVYSDATNKIDEILTNEPDFTPLPEVGSSFIYSKNSWDFRKQGTVTTGTLASNKTELVNGNKIEFSDSNQTSSLLNGIPFNSGAGTQKYIILDDYGNISSNSSNVNNLGDEFSIEVYFKLPAESDLNNTDQNLIFNLSDTLPANVTSTNPQNSIFLTVKSSTGNVSNNLVDYCLYAYNGQNSYVKWSPTYPVGETSPGIYTGAQQTIAAGTYHDMAHKKSEFVWLLISVKLDSTGANLPTVTFFEHFQQHSVANDTYIKERTSTTTNAGTIDSIKTSSYWASRRIIQIGGENKILGHDSGYVAADFYAKTFRLFTGYTFTLGMADQLRRTTDIRNNPFTFNDNTNLDPWHLDRVTRNDEKDSRFSNVAYPRLLMNFLATTAPTFTGTGSINSTDGLVVGSGYSVTLTGVPGTNMGYIGGDEFSIETVFKFDTFASDQTIFEFYTDNSSSGASSDFFKQYTFTPNQVYRFILRRFGSTRRLELLVDTFQDDYHGASVLASDQGKPTHRPGIAPEDINSNATSNWVQGQNPLRIISEEIDASIFPSSGAMPEFAHMVLTYKRKSTTSKEVETDKCKLFIKRADNNYKPYDYQLKFRNDSDANLTDQPSNPQTGFIPYVKREFHNVNGNIKMKLLNFYDHALLNDVEANYLNAGEIQKVFRYYQETNGSKFYTLGRSVDFTTCTTSSAATEHPTDDSHKTTIGATTTTEPFNVVTSFSSGNTFSVSNPTYSNSVIKNQLDAKYTTPSNPTGTGPFILSSDNSGNLGWTDSTTLVPESGGGGTTADLDNFVSIDRYSTSLTSAAIDAVLDTKIEPSTSGSDKTITKGKELKDFTHNNTFDYPPPRNAGNCVEPDLELDFRKATYSGSTITFPNSKTGTYKNISTNVDPTLDTLKSNDKNNTVGFFRDKTTLGTKYLEIDDISLTSDFSIEIVFRIHKGAETNTDGTNAIYTIVDETSLPTGSTNRIVNNLKTIELKYNSITTDYKLVFMTSNGAIKSKKTSTDEISSGYYNRIETVNFNANSGWNHLIVRHDNSIAVSREPENYLNDYNKDHLVNEIFVNGEKIRIKNKPFVDPGDMPCDIEYNFTGDGIQRVGSDLYGENTNVIYPSISGGTSILSQEGIRHKSGGVNLKPIKFGGSISIEAVFRFDGNVNLQRVFTAYNSTSTHLIGFARLYTDNKLWFDIDGGSRTTTNRYGVESDDVGDRINHGFHHVLFTHNATDSNFSSASKIYLDGQAIGTNRKSGFDAALPFAVPNVERDYHTIGKDWTANAGDTTVKYIKLYNRVINSTDASEAYKRFIKLPTPDRILSDPVSGIAPPISAETFSNPLSGSSVNGTWSVAVCAKWVDSLNIDSFAVLAFSDSQRSSYQNYFGIIGSTSRALSIYSDYMSRGPGQPQQAGEWTSGNIPINKYEWKFLVITKNGTTQKIYQDGKLMITGYADFNSTFTDNTFIGYGGASTNYQAHDGELKNYGLWNGELTADEVKSLYNNGNVDIKKSVTPTLVYSKYVTNDNLYMRTKNSSEVLTESIPPTVNDKTGHHSISFSVYWRDLSDQWACPLALGLYGFEIAVVDTSGSVGIWVHSGPGTVTLNNGHHQPQTNRWYHYVATKYANGNSTEYKLYVDGVLHGTGIGVNSSGTFNKIHIGWNGNETDRGKYDAKDFAVWDGTLSATDVADIYNNGDVNNYVVVSQNLVFSKYYSWKPNKSLKCHAPVTSNKKLYIGKNWKGEGNGTLGGTNDRLSLYVTRLAHYNKKLSNQEIKDLYRAYVNTDSYNFPADTKDYTVRQSISGINRITNNDESILRGFTSGNDNCELVTKIDTNGLNIFPRDVYSNVSNENIGGFSLSVNSDQTKKLFIKPDAKPYILTKTSTNSWSDITSSTDALAISTATPSDDRIKFYEENFNYTGNNPGNLIKKYKKVNRILTKEEEKHLESIGSSEGHNEIGLIAQDLIRTEFDDMISSDEGKLAVNYVSLIAMLCEELKRKRNEVNHVKSTFEAVKTRFNQRFPNNQIS